MSYIKQAIDMTLAIKPTYDLDKDTVVVDELLKFMLDNFTLPKTFDEDDKDCLEVIQETRDLFDLSGDGDEWYLVLVEYPPKLVEAVLPIALIMYLIACRGCVNMDFDVVKSTHWDKFVEVYGEYILY